MRIEPNKATSAVLLEEKKGNRNPATDTSCVWMWIEPERCNVKAS